MVRMSVLREFGFWRFHFSSSKQFNFRSKEDENSGRLYIEFSDRTIIVTFESKTYTLSNPNYYRKKYQETFTGHGWRERMAAYIDKYVLAYEASRGNYVPETSP